MISEENILDINDFRNRMAALVIRKRANTVIEVKFRPNVPARCTIHVLPQPSTPGTTNLG